MVDMKNTEGLNVLPKNSSLLGRKLKGELKSNKNKRK